MPGVALRRQGEPRLLDTGQAVDALDAVASAAASRARRPLRRLPTSRSGSITSPTLAGTLTTAALTVTGTCARCDGRVNHSRSSTVCRTRSASSTACSTSVRASRIDDRVFGIARDPVVLAEIRPHQDAEALEHLVADAVPIVLVDRRQVIDVEEDQRNRQTVAAGAVDFLRQHGLEERARVQSGQAVDHRGAAGSSCARSV